VNTVYIFDFDDTLAHTDGSIGIARFVDGENVEPDEWLNELGVDKSYVIGYESTNNALAAYLNSSGFREYVVATKPALANKSLSTVAPMKMTGFGVEDVIDFSRVSDVVNPRPLEHIVTIARNAVANGHIVGVITGRSGQGTTIGMDGTRKPVTTRKQIQKFLALQGVLVSMEDIYGVGHMPGSVASNKAKITFSQFIEKYDANIVKFYDDDSNNLSSVATLDSPTTRVSVFDTTQNVYECNVTKLVESARRRRLQVSDWDRVRKMAKIKWNE